VVTDPVLTCSIFEEVVKESLDIKQGERLHLDKANMLLNLSSTLYEGNLQLSQDNTFRPDDSFLRAFALFIDRVPASAFRYADGRVKIVNYAVL